MHYLQSKDNQRLKKKWVLQRNVALDDKKKEGELKNYGFMSKF